jgi:hypothetical protein
MVRPAEFAAAIEERETGRAVVDRFERIPATSDPAQYTGNLWKLLAAPKPATPANALPAKAIAIASAARLAAANARRGTRRRVVEGW